MFVYNYQPTTNFKGKYSTYSDNIDESEEIENKENSECDVDSDDFFNFPDTFREQELHNPETDYNFYSDIPYSEDDIPIPFIPQRSVILDINYDKTTNPAKQELKYQKNFTDLLTIPCLATRQEETNHIFDTSEPPYVILKKTGKKIYIESFFDKKNVDNIHRQIENMVSKGYDLSDTINIYHNAILKKGEHDELSIYMLKEAFALLNKGRNIDYIINIMNNSKKTDKNSDYESYNKGTLLFKDKLNNLLKM